MDTMVAMGIVLIAVGLYYLLKYAWKRFWLWLAVRSLEHYDTDMWEWDNLAAADVRDYEDNVRRQSNG